jgi:hypothetical protein
MSVMAGCGVAAAVAVAALISLFIVLVLRGRMQGEGAQKAATQVVLAFTENWTPEPLMRQASKDLREKVTAEEAARLFEIYKRLGTRTSLGEPTGTTTASSGFGTFASGIRAEFAFPATFTTGPATIRIRMIREDNAWKVDGFWIESKALLGST